jgi:hypothetical protein
VGAAVASVGIGSASSAFRSERVFDIAGHKLAGLLQQVLSAHIFVKIVALVLVGAPVIWAWGCLYAAITGAPISLGVFKVVGAAAAGQPWCGVLVLATSRVADSGGGRCCSTTV